MAAAHHHEEAELIGFEDAMSWLLPSHVLHELAYANTNKGSYSLVEHKKVGRQQNHYKQRYECINNARRHYNRINPNCWASVRQSGSGGGGGGMQASFIESSSPSLGTGVFLPPRLGTNFQPRNKPVCSPVLLPSRVIQALNLNVHELGLQISPRQDPKRKASNGDQDSCNIYNNNNIKNDKNNNNNNSVIRSNHKERKVTRVISENQNPSASSPETFLPKEWTY